VKSLLLRLSHIASYEIRRPGATGRSMQDALNHLRRVGFRPNTILDVGVANGTLDLYRVYSEPTYLLVEPIAEFEPRLKELLAQKIHGSYAIAAAGAKPGRVKLTVRGEASSLYREVDRSDSDAQVREVPLTTLDELCRERGLKGPYLVKIDVQGAELEVLAGAQEVLRETDAVVLEASLFQLLEGIPDFTQVVQRLNDYGFVTYDLFGGLSRPADGTLAQIDVVFVKKIGPLRQYHGFR
jgi:FkbM family methyltransferase